MNYKSIFNLMGSGTVFITVFLALISIQAEADGWDIFGQHDQMKEYIIADVGEVSKIEPQYGTKQEKEVYQMNGRCFIFAGYAGYWGYGKKAALLLVNEKRKVQLALIETSIGSIKVEMKPIRIVECS